VLAHLTLKLQDTNLVAAMCLSGELYMDHVDDAVGFLAGEAARQGCYSDGCEYGCMELGSHEELPCKVV
jgi:hypothetical protein